VDPLSSYDAIHQKIYGALGGDPLPFGIEANRATLEAFVQYNVDQKVIPRKLNLEEVFEPSTLELVD
jgi:4,5-dihydroxyphthalate decarboxylase